jgi:hypothetical protein
MSQTTTIAPPILPEGSPDREVNCEVALESAFAALVASSIAQGWSAEETAATLLHLATDHLEPLKTASAAEAATASEPTST